MRTTTYLTTALLATTLIAHSSSAMAAFLWEQQDEPPIEEVGTASANEQNWSAPSQARPSIEQARTGLDGKPLSLLDKPAEQSLATDLETSIYRGFGTDLPLSIALAQIPPAGVVVEAGYGVDSSKKVSWTGNKPWKEALAEAAGAELSLSKLTDKLYLLARRIDTQDVVSASTADKPDQSNTIQTAQLSDAPEAPTELKATVQVNPVPENPFQGIAFSDDLEIPKLDKCPTWKGDPGPRREWSAAAGQTLEEVLREWTAIGATEKWTLVWDTNRTYPIKASATFDGYFCEALALIVSAFRTDDYPPKANGKQKNNVLLVTTLDDMDNN